METSNRYWFRAKRYGWGWGWPTAWQGWLVLAAYAAIIALLATQVRPRVDLPVFAIAVSIPTLALIAICVLKGEPLHWRWGGR